MTKRLYYFVFLLLGVGWSGELMAYNYLPIVKCFDKSAYQAGRQNWDIGIDSQGIVYFGNNDGLLRYIYGTWQLSCTEGEDVVRSVCVENDTVWTGGVAEYGFFVKNSPENMKYVQIGKIDAGQIWEIQALNGKVFLQTEGSIIVYDKLKKEQQVITGNDGFFGIQVWKDNLWALSRDGSIGFIDGKELKVVQQFNQFRGVEVRKLFVHNEELHILLFDGRIYVFNGQDLKLKVLPESIDGKAFFTAASYSAEELLIGTISDGLVHVSDEEKHVLTQVNTDDDLIDNTVLSIAKDVNGNIWLGLDYGIAFIEMQNVVRPIFNKGATYFIYQHGDSVYLATNKGVYVSTGYLPFHLVKGTEGQAWRIREINNQIYVCHNKGLLKVNTMGVQSLYLNEGIMDVATFPSTNLYLFSSYSGLLLMRYERGQFTYLENLNIWGNPKLAFDPQNDCIWADSRWDSPIALALNESNQITRINYPNVQTFFNGANRFVFYDGNQLLELKNKAFVPMNEAPFDSIRGAKVTALDFDQSLNFVGYVKNGVPNLLANLHDGNFYSYQKLLSSLQDNLIENDEFISVYGGELRIATDRGVTTFNVNSGTKHPQISSTAISKIVVQDENEKLEFTFPYKTDQITLEAGSKNIHFYFGIKKATSDFAEFRYRLWPYDKEWSDWSANIHMKEYTQLKGGFYKFSLQSRLNGGLAKEQSISLLIEKNWYQTQLVGLPLLLLFLGCIFVTVRIMSRLNQKKLQKQKEVHVQRMADQTIAMKNEQLLQYTEVISRKNEFLMELKDGLARMRNNEAKQWEQRIMDEVSNEKRSFLFHKLFSELHQDFIARLNAKHPGLSANDIRVLSFIRINLGTKEIASLMNISPKSVDISRYRLRKKMDLPHETDLNQYIRDL
jgi:DNA-binding CsgD family transcriptional regulator